MRNRSLGCGKQHKRTVVPKSISRTVATQHAQAWLDAVVSPRKPHEAVPVPHFREKVPVPSHGPTQVAPDMGKKVPLSAKQQQILKELELLEKP